MAGKGSKSRPIQVNRKTYEDNWDKIFGNKDKDKIKDYKYNQKDLTNKAKENDNS